MSDLNLGQLESKLGQICIQCAQIDSLCISLIQHTFNCDAETCAAIAQSAEMPAKRFELWKRLAHLSGNSTEYTQLSSTLSKVAIKVMQYRNRLIHDNIRFEEGVPHRIDARAQLKGPSGQKSIHFNVKYRISREDLESHMRLTEHLIDVLAELSLWQLLRNDQPDKVGFEEALPELQRRAESLLDRLNTATRLL